MRRGPGSPSPPRLPDSHRVHSLACYHRRVGQLGFTFPAERKIWTVSGLLARLKQNLDREFFDVWIEGEISNLHQAASRHCYFTLKDAQGQIKSAMFAAQARWLKFKLRDGMQVMVRGRVSLYEARGELQCYVEHVEPLGKGGLQLAFEQLKEKLAAEGLFDPARKRPLPRLPRRIGLITSPRGAAIADMLHILRRRFPNLDILLYPVAVQGEAAAGEICRALAYFAQQRTARGSGDVDLLIVGRGGGSLEDLWPFNEETVARAIAASPIPTISAVGHETDFTIADFVADLRAPTPSAAAELAVRSKQEFLAEQAAIERHLLQAMRYRLLQRSQTLDGRQRHLLQATRQRLAMLRRRWALAADQARHLDARTRLQAVRGRLQAQQLALAAHGRATIQVRRHRLERLSALLEERNPLGILRRGYALVYNSRGELAASQKAFAPGDALRVRFADGWLDAEAKQPRP